MRDNRVTIVKTGAEILKSSKSKNPENIPEISNNSIKILKKFRIKSLKISRNKKIPKTSLKVSENLRNSYNPERNPRKMLWDFWNPQNLGCPQTCPQPVPFHCNHRTTHWGLARTYSKITYHARTFQPLFFHCFESGTVPYTIFSLIDKHWLIKHIYNNSICKVSHYIFNSCLYPALVLRSVNVLTIFPIVLRRYPNIDIFDFFKYNNGGSYLPRLFKMFVDMENRKYYIKTKFFVRKNF